jgi:uncharacterized protein (TIGR02588 family)
MGQAEQKKQEKQEIPPWERAVGIVGVLFLIGIVSFLIYEAMQPTTPPVVTVTTEEILSVEGGYLVEFRATNMGESTGAGIEIEGTLNTSADPQAEPVETSSTTFDYIPSKSSRHGGLFFQEDPNQYILKIQARGYTHP